jgi:hypothetical protein
MARPGDPDRYPRHLVDCGNCPGLAQWEMLRMQLSASLCCLSPGSPVAMCTHIFDLPQLTACRHLAMSHGGQAAAAPATLCPVAAQVA